MNRISGIAIAAGLIGVSAALRMYCLGASSYWIDEMVSLNLASHRLWYSIFWDNNPPLYHGLLKLWVAAFGDGESASRSLSVIFSVGATLLCSRIGYEVKKWPGACAFGAFHALSLLSVTYAQEARMYALFEFFMAANLLFFLRLVPGTNRGRPNVRDLWGYGITALLMSLTHYLSAIPLGIEVAILAWTFGRRSPTRWLALTVLGIIAGAGLVEIGSYLHFFHWEGLSWQLLKYEAERQSHFPGELLGKLSNDSWLFALGALVLIAGSRLGGKSKHTAILLAIVSAAPIFLLLPVSLLLRRAVFLPRYFIYIQPPLACLLGLIAAENWSFDTLAFSRKTLCFWGGLGFMFIGTVLSLPGEYVPGKEPWREVPAIISKYPGAPIFTTRTVAIGVPYLSRIGARVEKWVPSSEAGFNRLKQALDRDQRVWLIENYWGGYPYMSALAAKMRALNYDVSEVALRTDYSAPVLVMLIEKRKP